MNKRVKYFFVSVGCLGVLFLAVFVIFLFRNSRAASMGMEHAVPDNVAVSVLSHGDRVLVNRTAGYQIAFPQDWYFEKSAGPDVALYPEYDPAQNGSPFCKIEISKLPNPDHLALGDWLHERFQEDPTAEIRQDSLSQSTIAGNSAIIWSGSENGASTTLAYVAHADVVFEIAPSLMATEKNSSVDFAGSNCANAFGSVMSSFEFLN